MVELKKQNFWINKIFYNRIEKELRKKLKGDIPIEQVGSTAIPNMYGKNIIDILIGAKDNIQFEKIKNILESMNYIPSAKSKDEIYQFFSSTSDETGSGDVHIHLVIEGTQRYLDFICLKKYLLNNKIEAKNYSNFKRKLINNGILERKEYNKLKSEYVTLLLQRARNSIKDNIILDNKKK